MVLAAQPADEARSEPRTTALTEGPIAPTLTWLAAPNMLGDDIICISVLLALAAALANRLINVAVVGRGAWLTGGVRNQ